MRSLPPVVVVVGALLAGGGVAEARIADHQRLDSPLAAACGVLQDQSDYLSALLAANIADGLWMWLTEVIYELAAVGASWDTVCAATFGSITREAPASAVPTLHDGDGDLLFDEDELVYGLDPDSPDTDRDGLVDDVDPSWLGDLLVDLGQARLAAMAAQAEADVSAGDRAAAAELLVDIEQALGGCEPDPVTFAPSGSEACRAARTLEVHLGRR